MARRASSSFHPVWIIACVVGLILIGIAGKSWFSQKAVGFTGVKPLVLQDLLDNGNSLRGNEYSVKGEVDEKLQWTSGRGQVVSVKVRTDSGDSYLGIEVPPEFSKLNIEIKQSYHFRVKFRQGGIAVATDIQRL